MRPCVTAIDRQVSYSIVPFLGDQEGLVFTVKIRRSFHVGRRFIQQILRKSGSSLNNVEFNKVFERQRRSSERAFL